MTSEQMFYSATKAFDSMVLELSLIRKQLEKLDRTVAKLNESPTDIVDGTPSQE